MEDKKIRIEALRRLASLRSQKVLDKYKDSNPLEESTKATNEGYDIIHKGMTQEEKEQAAERDYHRKRREAGLE